jgi:membrane protease YdiL (CAAX protease family)
MTRSTRHLMIAGRTAAAIVLALWILYTAIYTLPLAAGWRAILEFVPGLLAVAVLRWAGYRDGDWTVRAAPLSRPGLMALVLVLPVLFAPILSGKWVGFDLLATLVFPLASGVTQEIFFRGALLPASIRLCGGRSMRGVVLQAVLFGLWHAPKAYLSAPAGVSPWVGVIALSVVTFLAGLGWGWQVQRDRTIIWAMGQHIIFLMIMSLFGM